MAESNEFATRLAPRRKVLVLGAQGMLGHMLVRVLSDRHEVSGSLTGRYESVGRLQKVLSKRACVESVDVTDFVAVTRAILDREPNVVVNCVGLIKHKMDRQSALKAIMVNSVFPHQLAKFCSDQQIRLIHFSTDCVFRGRPGLKQPSDVPDATDVYGMTKRLGEIDYGSALTLRTSFVGRQLSGNEELFEWILSQRGNSIKGFRRAVYSGLTTQALSNVVQRVIEEQGHLSGLFQVASAPISKFDLIMKFNEVLELGLTVEPDTSYECDRSLDGSEFQKVTGIEVPSWDTMLNNFVADQYFYA